MALSRRNSGRFSATIWPGFVDAMTALILVLFFVLSIFMIVQFVLRDTITGQGQKLDELTLQVANLADALGLERSRADRQAELVATVTGERDAAVAEISEYETRVQTLLSRNTELADSLKASEAETAAQLDAKQALEAIVASLRDEKQAIEQRLADQADDLSEAEAERLAQAAAAELLRERLEGSQAELTALSLQLEEQRKKAEDTLTLLAAAEAARDKLQGQERVLSEAEKTAAELAQARALLSEEQQVSAESQRQVALLNQQTAELRSQLDALQGLLDEAEARDRASKVQIEKLGSNLNAALARVAAEQSAKAELEEREKERLAAEAAELGEEARDLRRYRSVFFGRMRDILANQPGVRIVGDRFVFDSEVLFQQGSATLGAEGREQVAQVARVIKQIAGEIPPGINWIIRVDGHTDKVPVGFNRQFRDNWELSTARALSVVKYMVDAEGIPPERLAAAGFGEFQPIDAADTPEAYARNRRIEMKFTER